MAQPAGTDAGEEILLTGWGRTAPTRATVHRPVATDDVERLLKTADPRGVLARGLGRSYGDAAQNAGGQVVDMTLLARVHDLDLRRGTVTVDAGVSLDALLRVLLPLGWFVAVSPGTRMVTVGGAIAADIHGKNHHHDGSFCSHVASFRLITPAGDDLTVTPGETPEIFWATAGGMGLTGVIVEATLQLLAVETSRVRVDTERAADLDDVMARLQAGDVRYRYSVAWIDLLAQGSAMGRSVITRGDHATLDELPAAERPAALAFAPRTRLAAPAWVPSGLLRPATVRAFNEAWYRKAPSHETGALQSLNEFFHPLDFVADWNRIYGRAGFLQYQFVVPFGEEDTLRRVVEELSRARSPSFLAVLKRFGAQPGLLSFPLPGWTLALDLPAGVPALGRLLDRLDGFVVGCGGRVYFAKDSRMRAELVPAMYPRLEEWRAIRNRLDPNRALRSDLDRRLGLTDERPAA